MPDLENVLNAATREQGERATAAMMPRDPTPTDAQLVGLRRWWDAFAGENTPAAIGVMANEYLELRASKADLLEVCEWVLDWLSSFSMPPTSTIQEKQDAMAKLEAAIAKATGRKP